MKKIHLTLLFSATLFQILAQGSLLEDADGEGSFKVWTNTITVNAGESAIKTTIIVPPSRAVTTGIDFYEPGDPINQYRIIIDDVTFILPPGTSITTVSGKVLRAGDEVRRILHQTNFLGESGFTINGIASDGTSNLFSEGKLNPKGEVGFFRTFYGGNDSLSEWDYFSIAVGLSAKDVSLVDTGALFADPTNKTSFGYNLECNYNRVGTVAGSTSLFGIGLSYVNRDNSSQLSPVKYDVTTTLATSGNQTATQQGPVEGFDQSVYEANQNTLNINMDYGFYPNLFNDRLLVASQLRGKAKEGIKTTWNFGFGFYLADEDVSTKIIGGINVIASDLTKAVSTKPFDERITINLVAGFKI